MKEKGFWTRPRPHLDVMIAVATAIAILLVREWRYSLVLLCIAVIGVLIALLLRFVRRKDSRITLTGIR